MSWAVGTNEENVFNILAINTAINYISCIKLVSFINCHDKDAGSHNPQINKFDIYIAEEDHR
jgi:hypothetical protein